MNARDACIKTPFRWVAQCQASPAVGKSTLQNYCSPIFGKVAVQAVDVPLVMKVLEPIWATKPETASRLRGRIEAILDWAKVRGLRVGENPARWRGHLDHLLPARAKVRKVKHHAALPYVQISTYLDGPLRQREGYSSPGARIRDPDRIAHRRGHGRPVGRDRSG